MRVLYLDIDTLRADHLGCYGYPRKTTPNLDWIASEGVRFENCHVSDAPCLPSRAAFYSGKFGIRNGVVNHGGEAADLYLNPAERGFRTLGDNFIIQMRRAGLYPVSVSPFGERHSAFWFYNGFREMYNTGKGGGERADEVVPIALEWLDRKGRQDNWYLHVNVWDPHTPYQAPKGFGKGFEKDAAPEWMTEEIRRKTWDTYGPGCAQEPGGDYTAGNAAARYERMTGTIDSLAAFKKWVDGYDDGVRYADHYMGLVLKKLEEIGVLDDTLIVVTSDHGEQLGELAVYGDHQAADYTTTRVPMIIRHPKGLGGKGRADWALHYQFDIGATLIEMLGGKVPGTWDGASFHDDFARGRERGREFLVVSNCAWSCQRSVRWADYMFIRTYHSGFKNWPDAMLFNVREDPHEVNDLARERPELANEGAARLERWWAEAMSRSPRTVDPMWIVMREGGPYHANYKSPSFEQYKQRLKETGRGRFAEELELRSAKCKVQTAN